MAGFKGKMSSKDDERNQDQDLTTILDYNQRAELTLLLANSTEAMRQNIMDNFDATATLNKGLVNNNYTEDEKIMNPDIDPSTADVNQNEREQKLKLQWEKQISSSQMKDLKNSALDAYDEWRQAVITRVGEVVNNSDAARGQGGEVHSSKPQPTTQTTKTDALDDSRLTSTSLHELFPPIETPLLDLDVEKRILILHSLLLLLLSLEHYSAPSRVLLLYIASSLNLSADTLSEDEAKVAQGLMEAAKQMSGDSEIQKKAETNKDSRKWKVGIASVAGAALIGVTGGLAAPLVAAGVGAVMGGLGLGATAAAGYLGAVASSTVIVGGLFGAYGGRMTGKMMDKYAREVEDFKFLPVHPQKSTEDPTAVASEDRRLKVTVCITGWLTDKEDVVQPWKVLGDGAEVFALRWELEALMRLGNSMKALVTSAAWGYARSEILKRTVFADLMVALWPIGLLKVSRLVDNPFSVAKARAEKAGEVLADAIINKAQGERPLTLIGYSLGSRVIYSCLMSLAQRKVFGLVESVVLMGSPIPSDTRDWRIMRTVVSGRLINVYSENDYVLGFLYRTSSVQLGVAGLQKVEGLSGVENLDVSEIINGHLRYRYLVGSILKKIGFEDIDMEQVQIEEEELRKMEEEQEKIRASRQKQYKEQEEDGSDTKETEDLEQEAKSNTDKGMMAWAYEKFRLGGPNRSDDTNAEVSKDEKTTQRSYMQRAYASIPHRSGSSPSEQSTDKGGDGQKNYLSRAYGNIPQFRRKDSPEQSTAPKNGQDSNYLSKAYARVPKIGAFGSKGPSSPIHGSRDFSK